jgi:hypothetical protein
VVEDNLPASYAAVGKEDVKDEEKRRLDSQPKIEVDIARNKYRHTRHHVINCVNFTTYSER